jgi:Protease inhibitor Inh
MTHRRAPRSASAFTVGVLTCGFACALPAVAQQMKPAPAKPGAWTIARTTEWPDFCSLRLLESPTIGGQEVRLGKDCVPAFAWTADVAAWRTSPGSLVLADATRRSIITFRQVPDGGYVGTGPDKIDYTIDPDRTRGRR